MKRMLVFFIAVTLWLITAHRLPAPISEIPESPTPGPEQSAKPKPKRATKPKASESSERPIGRTSDQSATGASVSQLKLAGTWSGILTVSGVLATTPNATFIINPTQNAVQWTDSNNTKNYAAVAIGNSISWKAGSFSEINCRLTVLSDGQTAQVKITSVWGSAIGTVKKQN